jgi:hypothetical protein
MADSTNRLGLALSREREKGERFASVSGFPARATR